MSYLLDTHVWLWAQREPQRLGKAMREAMRKEGNAVSAVSLWETALLVEHGRVVLPKPLEEIVADQRAAGSFQFLGVSPEVALAFRDVPAGLRDPADRLLVATARVHGLTLMTEDRRLLETPGVPCWRGRR